MSQGEDLASHPSPALAFGEVVAVSFAWRSSVSSFLLLLATQNALLEIGKKILFLQANCVLTLPPACSAAVTTGVVPAPLQTADVR